MKILKRLWQVDRNTLAMASVAVAVVLFLSFNILTSETLTSARLDLTADKLYTLSNGTREVLKSIKEPITLRFYLSKQLMELSPVHANYANRVKELLERYAGIANGMLKLKIYYPEPFSIEDDQAMAAGLQGIPINEAGEKGYFGLSATNSTDDQETIPFFDPSREQYLEYDLTKLIYALADPKKRVIGLLTSLPLAADPEKGYRPWPIYRQLKRFFDVRSLKATGPVIDPKIKVVLVVHPKELTRMQRFALDQFVLRGGRAVVFVDPYFESQTRDPKKGPPKKSEISSNMKKLFKAWGVAFDTNTVIGDRRAAQRVTAQSGGREVVTDYLTWLALGPAYFNRNDVVVGQIKRLNMASAGFFTSLPGATTTLTPLVTSSPDAMQIDVNEIDFIPDPVALLGRFKSAKHRFVLAARVSGPAKSAFSADSPWVQAVEAGSAETPSDEKGSAAKPSEIKFLSKSVKPINVVLVGDVDILADRFWLQMQNLYGRQVGVPVANNAEFLVNILDNLSGSDALISLRSRGLSYRPFTRIADIRSAAEVRYRETERTLMGKLKGTEKKLRDLREKDAGAGIMLTAEQKDTIASFRSQAIQIRKQLRNVQHALRKDIETMDIWVKAINIWTMPLLISLIALILALVRRARYRRRTLHS